MITANVSPEPLSGELSPVPGRFWIPEFSENLNRQWEGALKAGHEYYLSTTLPLLRRRFAAGPP